MPLSSTSAISQSSGVEEFNILEERGVTVCVEGVFIPGSLEWFVFTTRGIPFTSNNQTKCLKTTSLSLATRNCGALKVYVN